jgi:tetratricopeptide (TPR) repeat protein
METRILPFLGFVTCCLLGCNTPITEGEKARAANETIAFYDRVIADCDRALDLNPDIAHAHNNRTIAYNSRGDVYHKKGDYDRAIADYDKALALNPNYANAYNNRGNAYAEGKRDYDRAIADFDKGLALNPNFAAAYYKRGIAYDNKGDYDRAIADYDKAIALRANSRPPLIHWDSTF